jgi:hypothetical protein
LKYLILRTEPIDVRTIVNREFVINYDLNRDLLPIVKSNFSYNAIDSTCKFRYQSITDKIVDRYFQTKAFINLKTIPLYEYADEINDFTLFSKLNEIIQQVSRVVVFCLLFFLLLVYKLMKILTISKEIMDAKNQMDVFNDFKNINQTADALNVLKIIINYARTTSAKGDEIISNFIKRIYLDSTLANYEQILKPNIAFNCELRHLRHIWLILMTKRAYLYTINRTVRYEFTFFLSFCPRICYLIKFDSFNYNKESF